MCSNVQQTTLGNKKQARRFCRLTCGSSGRVDWIRTSDPLTPRQRVCAFYLRFLDGRCHFPPLFDLFVCSSLQRTLTSSEDATGRRAPHGGGVLLAGIGMKKAPSRFRRRGLFHMCLAMAGACGRDPALAMLARARSRGRRYCINLLRICRSCISLDCGAPAFRRNRTLGAQTWLEVANPTRRSKSDMKDGAEDAAHAVLSA